MKTYHAALALGLAMASAGAANAIPPCTDYPNGAGCQWGARTQTKALQALQALAEVERAGGERAVEAARLGSRLRAAWRAYLDGGSTDAVEAELGRAREFLGRGPAK